MKATGKQKNKDFHCTYTSSDLRRISPYIFANSVSSIFKFASLLPKENIIFINVTNVRNAIRISIFIFSSKRLITKTCILFTYY